VIELSENNGVGQAREKWIDYGDLMTVSKSLHADLKSRKGTMNEWWAGAYFVLCVFTTETS
jgi:hypothetical protein